MLLGVLQLVGLANFKREGALSSLSIEVQVVRGSEESLLLARLFEEWAQQGCFCGAVRTEG